MAGVKGRSGKHADKTWRDAIRLAIARRDKGDVKAIGLLADALLDKALEGDMQALKEIGDRLDGKAIQATAITDSEGNDVPVGVDVRIISRPS